MVIVDTITFQYLKYIMLFFLMMKFLKMLLLNQVIMEEYLLHLKNMEDYGTLMIDIGYI